MLLLHFTWHLLYTVTCYQRLPLVSYARKIFSNSLTMLYWLVKGCFCLRTSKYMCWFQSYALVRKQ